MAVPGTQSEPYEISARFYHALRATALRLEANARKPYEAGGLWLVRPDGYVGFAAKANAWDEAANYLDQIGAQKTQ